MNLRENQIMICGIDVLMLILILFVLVFFSIKYDADKGVGEHDYVKINPLLEDSDNIQGDWKSFNYFGIVLRKNVIELYHYKYGDSLKLGQYSSIDEMIVANKINKDSVYVIYEQENSPYLAKLIRYFSTHDIPIGLAKAGI